MPLNQRDQKPDSNPSGLKSKWGQRRIRGFGIRRSGFWTIRGAAEPLEPFKAP